VVFSDTVGFIRKLPHHLVAAFRSTLEQLTFADLVLHVVDRSHPAWSDQQSVADEVLRDLGVEPSRVVTVYNKIDRSSDAPGVRGGDVYVSARTDDGIEALRHLLRGRLFGVSGDGEVAPIASPLVEEPGR